MSEPFLGEIRVFGFNFPPRGWALCDGQILPIDQNQSLFSLLGTTYGGDGRTTFALPDLRGRVPLHPGVGLALGARGGVETVALAEDEMPAHAHGGIRASAATATQSAPGTYARLSEGRAYGPPEDRVAFDPSASPAVGGQIAHENMQPYTTVSFAIALQGLFPPRS